MRTRIRFLVTVFIFVSCIVAGCSSKRASDEPVQSTDEALTFQVPPSYNGVIGHPCLGAYASGGWGPHCNTGAGCNQSRGYCEACGHSGQACCDGPKTCASGTCYATSPADPNANVMCFEGTCDRTHHCTQPCGLVAGGACCPPDAAHAWATCRGDHLICNYAGGVGSGACVKCGSVGAPPCEGNVCDPASQLSADWRTCEACGWEGQPACGFGTCNSNRLIDLNGTCVRCGGELDPTCTSGAPCNSDRLNVVTNVSASGQVTSSTCRRCGDLTLAACATGRACNPPTVVDPPGYTDTPVARAHEHCGQCGICGKAACGGGATAPTCGSGLTAFADARTGLSICWLTGNYGSCGGSPPPSCSSSGNCSGGGAGSTGAGAGGSSGGGAGSAPACECTPSSSDTAAGITKCGQGLGGPCDPAASLDTIDKSRLCAPTLGCVPDALGNNFTCQAPGPTDHWNCDSTTLQYCWASIQAGACEGTPGVHGGGGSGTGGGTSDAGAGGGGSGIGGGGVVPDAGLPFCPVDDGGVGGTARVIMDPAQPCMNPFGFCGKYTYDAICTAKRNGNFITCEYKDDSSGCYCKNQQRCAVPSWTYKCQDFAICP